MWKRYIKMLFFYCVRRYSRVRKMCADVWCLKLCLSINYPNNIYSVIKCVCLFLFSASLLYSPTESLPISFSCSLLYFWLFFSLILLLILHTKWRRCGDRTEKKKNFMWQFFFPFTTAIVYLFDVLSLMFFFVHTWREKKETKILWEFRFFIKNKFSTIYLIAIHLCAMESWNLRCVTWVGWLKRTVSILTIHDCMLWCHNHDIYL